MEANQRLPTVTEHSALASREFDYVNEIVTWWERWLQQAQRSKLQAFLFQLHFWIGAVAGTYLTLMSVTGSILVFRDQLSRFRSVNWLVNLHADLLAGAAGRWVNGIEGGGLTFLWLTGAIIWWPGVKHWGSLQVSWRASFPRINWDSHSAIGFWFFPIVLLWGISRFYFTFPQAFLIFFKLDPADRFTDRWLFWLSELHFGRFTRLTEAL